MTEPSPRAMEIAVIWLAPECDVGPEGRMWCPDNVWSDGCECGGNHQPIKYVLASATEELRKERDALAEYLAKMQAEAIAAMMTPLGIIPSAAEQRNVALEARVKRIRAETIEECARECDARNETPQEMDDWGPRSEAKACAAAIRALGASPLSNGPEEKDRDAQS